MAEESIYATSWSTAITTCPQCNSPLSYYDRRKSAFFGCPNCGTYFEKGSEGARVIRTFMDEERDKPAFPLGTRGIVDGKEYILVGFIGKKEDQDDVYWCEYAFYSPGEEYYLMLAEYNGHWMLIRRSYNQDFEYRSSFSGRDSVFDNGINYELYLTYKFIVVAAEGEFDWDIVSDEELVTYEYVNAPSILVNEKRDDTDSWFRALYVSPKKIMQLFEVQPEWFTARSGSAYFNPGKFYPRWKPLVKFTGILIGLMILLNLFLFVAKPGRQVFEGNFNCEKDTMAWGNSKPIITPSFKITGLGPVYLTMKSNTLVNNWIELPLVMVNEDNGKVYEVNKVLEYYHGYDDGESWSEGSGEQNAKLSKVPMGNYHLNIYPYTEQMPSAGDGVPPPDFYISVKQNEFLTLNFWLMFILIITYPFIQLIRKWSFENSKWFDKEYGTLNKE